MYSFTVYCYFMYFVSHVTVSTQDEEVITSYDGSQVWRIMFREDQDIATVKKLAEERVISIWSVDETRADFLVHSANKIKVNRVLNSRKLNHSVLLMDVQRRIDSLKPAPPQWNADSLRIGHRLNWKEYPTLKIIYEYFTYLTENFPSICNVTVIGNTAEKRPLKMLRVTNGNPENKVFLVISGAHAREWIAITSALYVLDKLVTKFDQLPQFMRDIDWLIIPVLNPDGYEYSHTHDRLWRKNRRNSVICKGVDINRNFDIDWDIVGITDKNECGDSYSGPYPFSEAESRALRAMMSGFKKKPQILLDLHSYGHLILYPWGAKNRSTPDDTLLWKTAKAMSQAIYNTSSSTYKFGTTYYVIYPATGSGIDWFYSSGVGLSFAIELSDKSDHGFLLPASYIEPIGEELFQAMKVTAKQFQPKHIKIIEPNSWF